MADQPKPDVIVPKPIPAKEPASPLSKPVEVRALETGFYDGCRIRPGTVFTLRPGLRPGKWMERASDGAVWDRQQNAWVPRPPADRRRGRANWWEPHKPAKTQAQLEAENDKRGRTLRELNN